jgi:hypothetical protein
VRKREGERGEVRALFPCKVGFANWVAINIAWQLPSATKQVVVAASSNPSPLSSSSCILHSASCHQPSLFSNLFSACGLVTLCYNNYSNIETYRSFWRFHEGAYTCTYAFIHTYSSILMYLIIVM